MFTSLRWFFQINTLRGGKKAPQGSTVKLRLFRTRKIRIFFVFVYIWNTHLATVKEISSGFFIVLTSFTFLLGP